MCIAQYLRTKGVGRPAIVTEVGTDRCGSTYTGREGETIMRQTLLRAMHQSDELVVRLEYLDSSGQRTTRIVSPIRFLARDRFLGLCLCRCEPRQFYLERCKNVELQSAHQYVMPVPISTAP